MYWSLDGKIVRKSIYNSTVLPWYSKAIQQEKELWKVLCTHKILLGLSLRYVGTDMLSSVYLALQQLCTVLIYFRPTRVAADYPVWCSCVNLF